LVIIRAAALGAISTTFAEYMLRSFGHDPAMAPYNQWVHYVAATAIAIMGVLNYVGVRWGTLVQNTLTILKCAGLLAIEILALSMLPRTGGHFTPVAPAGSFGFVPFALALTSVLWVYDGWADVSFVGGEVKDPERNLPKVLIYGTLAVIALYLLANAGYVLTLPLDKIQHADNDRVGTATMEALFPTFGAGLMAAAILVSTFGCVNGLILSGARVTYAMARDGLFFRRVGTTNSRNVPAFALVTQGIWAVLLALPVTVALDHAGKPTYGNVYNQLLDYIIPVDLLFYTLMVGSVVLFRIKSPGVERPYRTFGYPITPLIYITLASLLILNFVYLSPQVSGIGFLIALTGLPAYLAWSRFGRPTAIETDPTSGTAPR